MALMQKIDIDESLVDIDAALAFVARANGQESRRDRLLLGGLLAWLSAARLHPDAAVGYYAGGIGNYAAESPKAPVQLHFGKLDTHIPAEQVDKVQAAHPEVEIHWYEDAGHGFNCDMRASLQP